MPLLDATISKKVSMTCSIEESIAIQVDQYAAFLGIPADDVVNKSLAHVFKNDKEFRQYIERNPEKPAAQSLKVRRPGQALRKQKVSRKQPLAIAQ